MKKKKTMNAYYIFCRKTVSCFLLCVMIIFIFYPSFSYAGAVSSVQWYISNGKDVVGTADKTGAKETKSYEYTPYGKITNYKLGITNGSSNIQHLTFNI